MGLIKCPDCGTEVSDQALACPRCARPLAKRKRSFIDTIARIGCLIYAFFIAIAIVGIVVAIIIPHIK